MFARLRCLLVKEFLQMLRDPKMRVMIFGMPVMQMLVFSFALTTDVTNVRLAVLDDDNTPASRELIQSFAASGYFTVVARANTPAQIDRMLDKGDIQTAVSIQAGFENDLAAGKTAVFQLLADGSDSNTTSIVMGYASTVAATFAQTVSSTQMSRRFPGFAPAQVAVETRAWFNPNLESKVYFVPGLFAAMLTVVSTMLTSIAIVREKEIGTIEQVMVTPVSRSEFILGKTTPFMLTGYMIFTMMLLLAMLVFGLRVKGNLFTLYALSGVFLGGNMGIALLISVSARTQQEALLTGFLFLVPAILLSGFMFPVLNMPVWLQYLTYLNPMRWYLEVLRGVVIRGASLAEIALPATCQILLAVGFLSLAVGRFKKTIA
jgi:ABC-2 type transport system permease protein